MAKRLATEVLATLAVVGTLAVVYQLRDRTSPLRLFLDEQADALREWSIRYRVDALIDTTQTEGSEQ